MQEPDDAALEQFEMPNTTYEILISNGYRTAGSVRRATDETLRSIPGIGTTRLQQIRTVVGLVRTKAPPSRWKL